MHHKPNIGFFVLFSLALMIQSCSGNSSTSNNNPNTQGAVQLSMVDAPGDYDHVYITVKDVWFHTSADAGPGDTAWLKFPLASPVTVDLIALSNGVVSQALWNNIQLPAGTYEQIRLFLMPTFNTPPSGHTYNNEIVIGGTTSPLRVPDAQHGIKLTGTFQIASGGTLKLAIDFDAGHDIVDLGNGEYVLKPRLAYFDLDNAGAIIGKISTGSTFTTTPRFVIKAERLNSDGTNTFFVVRRWTVPKSDGSFVLYPVSTLVTSTWDVLIRGLNYQTVIIRGVPITKGSLPASGATDLGTITMTAAAAGSLDYPASGSVASPTGAWVQFYQTLRGAGEYPYEVRFRHLNPIYGTFANFKLSNDTLQFGTYGNGTISLQTVTPAEGTGGYQVVADAILYNRGPWPGVLAPNVTSSSPTVTLGSLSVVNSWTANSVSGTIVPPTPAPAYTLDTGILFAVHGGMIVNAISTLNGTLDPADLSSGGTYTVSNLPGGSSTNPHPVAVYGVEAIGWSGTHPILSRAAAIPQLADLSTQIATGVTLTMVSY